MPEWLMFIFMVLIVAAIAFFINVVDILITSLWPPQEIQGTTPLYIKKELFVDDEVLYEKADSNNCSSVYRR